MEAYFLYLFLSLGWGGSRERKIVCVVSVFCSLLYLVHMYVVVVLQHIKCCVHYIPCCLLVTMLVSRFKKGYIMSGTCEVCAKQIYFRGKTCKICK